MSDSELNEGDIQKLYSWIDMIPMSRKKKSIARDFSDGLLVAEIIKHFIPRLVELHNYTSANSTNQKLSNWGTLNRKVGVLCFCFDFSYMFCVYVIETTRTRRMDGFM